MIPAYEAFNWPDPVYTDHNATSIATRAAHFGLITLLDDKPIQKGDEVAAYEFSEEAARNEWLKAAREQGWKATNTTARRRGPPDRGASGGSAPGAEMTRRLRSALSADRIAARQHLQLLLAREHVHFQ